MKKAATESSEFPSSRMFLNQAILFPHPLLFISFGWLNKAEKVILLEKSLY